MGKVINFEREVWMKNSNNVVIVLYTEKGKLAGLWEYQDNTYPWTVGINDRDIDEYVKDYKSQGWTKITKTEAKAIIDTLYIK